jgi:hypothetical protein
MPIFIVAPCADARPIKPGSVSVAATAVENLRREIAKSPSHFCTYAADDCKLYRRRLTFYAVIVTATGLPENSLRMQHRWQTSAS